MLNLAKRLFQEEGGQGMAEYGLILALVALGLVLALGSMREGISNAYQSTADGLISP
ncbi:MAG: Flp/Fap pilin component [Pelotomaculum sp. PtaU1.Bin035]|nr:MAG: Flp/Fap pilin component [Pelotomaculum sp. PtaU1.Bin035]